MGCTRQALGALFFVLALPLIGHGQDFKKWEAKTAEYKAWLDQVKADGHRFWLRLDGSHRPHRLYVGEGFHEADYDTKEQFVETFSRYLAGHPEKFVLIDLFDGRTGAHIGEFGWSGFKLYPSYRPLLTEATPEK